MALEVEDGTGKANADSYVSVLAADEYHAAYGNTTWAALSNGNKEIALRSATRYVDTHFKFRGDKLHSTQSLAFPRVGYRTQDIEEGWPVVRLNSAVFELALISTTTALYSNQQDRTVVEQTVGPITQKFSPNGQGGQVRFALPDELLAPLTAGSSNMTMKVVRAS